MSISRRTFALSLVLVPVLTLVGVAFAARPAPQDAREPEKLAPITVILVRHAEKASDDPRDPTLSDVGTARAARLAKMLASSGVQHVFASEFKRTRLTVEPLANAAKVAVEVVPAGKPEDLVAKLRALPPGAKALVAGHSNTVPKLAELLGAKLSNLEKGPAGEQFPDAQYDRIVVLTLAASSGGTPGLLELTMVD
ncbi:MAG: histidine phosphatase family protein [Planctomycetes bacterium]|nr:histidine phosphatase family protein [Planctomycetota bacterium]